MLNSNPNYSVYIAQVAFEEKRAQRIQAGRSLDGKEVGRSHKVQDERVGELEKGGVESLTGGRRVFIHVS